MKLDDDVVYLVHVRSDYYGDLFKIGHTTNIDRRLKQLRRTHSSDAVLVHIKKGCCDHASCYSEEQDWIQLFKNLGHSLSNHRNNEMFYLDIRLIRLFCATQIFDCCRLCDRPLAWAISWQDGPFGGNKYSDGWYPSILLNYAARFGLSKDVESVLRRNELARNLAAK